MWSFWVDANLCRFIIACLYMNCLWRPSYHEGTVGIPITVLTPPHFCAYPKPGHGFPTSYVVVFFCVQWFQLRWEVIVCFVDFDGIYVHHCIKFLFIIFLRMNKNVSNIICPWHIWTACYLSVNYEQLLCCPRVCCHAICWLNRKLWNMIFAPLFQRIYNIILWGRILMGTGF